MYAVVGILLSASLLSLYRYYAWKAVRQALEIERVRKEEEKRISDELYKKLHAKISGQATLIENLAQDFNCGVDSRKDDPKQVLSTIAARAKLILNEVHNINWHFDPSKDTLFDLIAYLKESGENLFGRTSTAFRIKGGRI